MPACATCVAQGSHSTHTVTSRGLSKALHPQPPRVSVLCQNVSNMLCLAALHFRGFGGEGVLLLKVLRHLFEICQPPTKTNASLRTALHQFTKTSSTTISSTMANPSNPTAYATLWLCISRLHAVNTKAAPPFQLHTFPPSNPFKFFNASHFIYAHPTHTFTQIFDNNNF